MERLHNNYRNLSRQNNSKGNREKRDNYAFSRLLYNHRNLSSKNNSKSNREK